MCRLFDHVARDAGRADRVVFAHVLYAITHPRAYELLYAPAPEVDAEALRAERMAIRTRLETMAEEEVLGKRTAAQVAAATRVATARIAEIDELLNLTVVSDPLADVVNAVDPVEAWANTPLADRRIIVDRLCVVTIMPARHGRRFDYSSVRVDPKHTLGTPPAEVLAAAV
jgi:hypothetical protein